MKRLWLIGTMSAVTLVLAQGWLRARRMHPGTCILLIAILGLGSVITYRVSHNADKSSPQRGRRKNDFQLDMGIWCSFRVCICSCVYRMNDFALYSAIRQFSGVLLSLQVWKQLDQGIVYLIAMSKLWRRLKNVWILPCKELALFWSKHFPHLWYRQQLFVYGYLFIFISCCFQSLCTKKPNGSPCIGSLTACGTTEIETQHFQKIQKRSAVPRFLPSRVMRTISLHTSCTQAL